MNSLSGFRPRGPRCARRRSWAASPLVLARRPRSSSSPSASRVPARRRPSDGRRASPQEIEARFRRDDSLAAWGVRDSALDRGAGGGLPGVVGAARGGARRRRSPMRRRGAGSRRCAASSMRRSATNICRFDLWNVDQLFGFHIAARAERRVGAARHGRGAGAVAARGEPLPDGGALADRGSPGGGRRRIHGAARQRRARRRAARWDARRMARAALLAPLARDSAPPVRRGVARRWCAIRSCRRSRAIATISRRDTLAKARAEPGLTALPNGAGLLRGDRLSGDDDPARPRFRVRGRRREARRDARRDPRRSGSGCSAPDCRRWRSSRRRAPIRSS